MVAISIRAATIADIPRLTDMRRAFTFEDQPRPPELRDDFEEVFGKVLGDGISSGRWVIAVAEIDGQLVSHAYLGVIEKIPRPTPGPARIAYLTNVYTCPEFRNQGLGTTVVRWLQNRARAQGVQLFIVWPSEESIEFYGRLGFVPSGESLVWHVVG